MGRGAGAVKQTKQSLRSSLSSRGAVYITEENNYFVAGIYDQGKKEKDGRDQPPLFIFICGGETTE